MNDPHAPLSWPLPSADIVGELADGSTLRLRAPVNTDIAGLVTSSRHEDSRRFTSLSENYSTRDAEIFLLTMARSPAAMLWIVDDPTAPGSFGGTLEVRLVDRHARCVELGYTTAPHLRGRGLMSAVVGTVVDFLFDYRVHRAQIKANPENLASCAVARKAGFRHEGTARDAELLHGTFNDLDTFARLATDD
ncbi:GNAT family N-acetyltransferase [Corynebacterium sp. AOP40-9SA-29]|uniref:GNAT family N-acetyltransferase n=1 Tax=Corynebacterium sp. AOP40-9SA-29 TaxID=3457677 RepID=UPI004033FB29